MGDLFAVLDGGMAKAVPLVSITHPGKPRGKGRPRGRIVMPRSGKSPFIHFYTDAETEAYETALRWRAKAAMRSAKPFEGPLAMRLFCMMPIPISWPQRDKDAALAGTKFPTSSFDFDNICKAVCDGFNGVVYLDDKQIIRALIVKEFATDPGIIAEFYSLP